MIDYSVPRRWDNNIALIKRVLFALVVILVVLGSCWLLRLQDSSEPAGSKVQSEAVNSNHSGKLESLNQAALEKLHIEFNTQQKPQTPSEQSTPEYSLAALSHSSFPYAKLIQLLEARKPGSYAGVRSLLDMCRIAFIASSGPAHGLSADTTSTRQAGALNYGVVLTADQAKQDIRARCGPLLEDRRLGTPLPGDLYGEKFKTVLNKLNDISGEELAQLYSGGEIDIATVVAGLMASKDISHFDGVLYGGLTNSDEYQVALQYAGLTLNWDPSAPSPHLATLAICARSGECTATPEQLAFMDSGIAPDRRTAIMIAGQQIADALRNHAMHRFALKRATRSPS